MFQVDRTRNRLLRLDEKRFGELAIRERDHLQEWLAEMPSALGEELLIIQKEFDGFDETRERLDLLALDKTGQLVVIENKLDDTGRDAVWQSLKYVAYCSSLTKSQIVEITQAYLDRHKGGGDARATIAEFLEVEDLDEVVLNPGNGQRLIFVAAHFRKEATSPVLWLISHGIAAQCFKVTPYAHGEELFLDVQQIIPTPEAAEFMIGMADKEGEEKTVQNAQRRSHAVRLRFWQHLSTVFAAAHVRTFPSVNVSTANWTTSPSRGGCHYSIVLTQRSVSLKLNFGRASKDENKQLFDALYAKMDEIEEAFGSKLSWRRMEESKASRIETHYEIDGFNEENWPGVTDWLVASADRFADTLNPHLDMALSKSQGYP